MVTGRTLAVIHLSVLTLAFGSACENGRTPPTAPSSVGMQIIPSLATTASAPRISERDRFTYRMSVTLHSPGVGANLSRVTVTLSEMSRVATVSHLGVMDAFGTTRVPAGGTITSTGIVFVGPLLPAGEATVRVTFADDSGNIGVAETSVGLKFAVAGAWAGPLQIGFNPLPYIPVASATLLQNGDQLSGALSWAVPPDSQHFSLNGSVSREWTPTLQMRGPEGLCSPTLLILDVEFTNGEPVRLSGRPTGRCFGTISGSFDFRRG